jgi:hypothetical protein
MLQKIRLVAEWLFDQLILPLLPERAPKTPPGKEDGS